MMGKSSGYNHHVDEPLEQSEDQPVVVSSEPRKRKCFGDGFKVIVAGCAIFSAAVAIGLVVDIYTRKTYFRNTAVVTDATECTKIARQILQDKGNAIDASVAAMICLTIVRPAQTSLSSGGFMLVHSKKKNVTIDFQFAAPNITQNLSKSSQIGQLVAIPGLLKGLVHAHKTYGRLSWSKIVSPSISLATNGFTVSNSTASNIRKIWEDMPNNMKEAFTVDGKPVPAGATLKLIAMAKTLKNIQNGDYHLVEQDIINMVKDNNGSVSLNDFNAYKPLIKEVFITKFKNVDVMSSALPSSGVIALSALNILSQLPKENTSVSYQLVVEVLKIVLAKQKLLQDPVFDPEQKNVTKELLDVNRAKEFAKEVLSKLNDSSTQKTNKVNTKIKPLAAAKVSIIDKEDESVSMISSLGNIFGSNLMTDSGIILNNGMSMFATSGKVNNIEPHKRPVVSACPAMVFSGKDRNKRQYSFSSSVDEEGLASLVQVLANLFQEELGTTQSLKQPRVFPDAFTNTLYIEGEAFAKAGLKDVTDYLKSLHPKVDDTVRSIGSVNIAYKNNTNASALLDPRLGILQT